MSDHTPFLEQSRQGGTADAANATRMTSEHMTVPMGAMRFSPKMPSRYQLRAVACVSPESEFWNVRPALSRPTPARYDVHLLAPSCGPARRTGR